MKHQQRQQQGLKKAGERAGDHKPAKIARHQWLKRTGGQQGEEGARVEGGVGMIFKALGRG